MPSGHSEAGAPTSRTRFATWASSRPRAAISRPRRTRSRAPRRNRRKPATRWASPWRNGSPAKCCSGSAASMMPGRRSTPVTPSSFARRIRWPTPSCSRTRPGSRSRAAIPRARISAPRRRCGSSNRRGAAPKARGSAPASSRRARARTRRSWMCSWRNTPITRPPDSTFEPSRSANGRGRGACWNWCSTNARRRRTRPPRARCPARGNSTAGSTARREPSTRPGD